MPIVGSTNIINSNTQVGANVIQTGNVLDGTLVNADFNAAAAIAYSKLALTGAVLNADLAGSITDSKLNQIATAGKVSGAAITSLASLPAGAGTIPGANLPGTVNKVLTTSRASNASGATQSIAHGLGKTPSKVRVMARYARSFNVWGIASSDGVFDGTNTQCLYTSEHLSSAGADEVGVDSSNIVRLGFEGSVELSASITVDATNINLVWAAGAGGGTVAQLVIECE